MLMWSDQELRWYKEAEQVSTYFDRLAQLISAELPPKAVVHDLGCGNGALAFRLAANGLRVTAVDHDPQAVNEVIRRNETAKHRIRVLQQDYENLEEVVPYPIFCLCGDIRSELSLLIRWQSNKVIIVTPDDSQVPFKIKPTLRKAICSSQMDELLRCLGLTYAADRVVEEFGQPLKDFSHAQAFAQHHNPHFSEDDITIWLAKNLQDSDFPNYRYYLPSKKRVTVFKIEGVGRQ